MGSEFKYSDEQIQDLLEGIKEGTISEYDIPEDLYTSTANFLKKGLYEGFGSTIDNAEGKDLELLTELRENVYMFSAAKCFQEIKQISSLMFDENGDTVSAREFSKLGKATFSTWDESYGLSEYQTAKGQAAMAVKWSEIERNKDILPVLVFSTDGHACPECAPYKGFSAPVDDPVWDWLTPLLHFNCECVISQEEESHGVSGKEDYDKVQGSKGNVPKEFQMNPGKDGYVFSPEHPYFDVAKKDRAFAKNNFGLPIPATDKEVAEVITGLSIEEAQKVMADFYVPESEKEALKNYTGESFNQINSYYRGIRSNISKEAETTAATLDKFIEGAPKVTAESYRGITVDEDAFNKFKELKKGEYFTDNAFMSTSYDKSITTIFSGSSQYQVEMTIKGKTGVLIEDLSDAKREKEILFGRGSRFKIESIKTEGKKGKYGKIFVTLSEL